MKIPSGVTRLAGRQILRIQSKSPTLLLAAGIVGTVTATVMACRATLRLEEALDNNLARVGEIRDLQHVEYSENDRKRDLALVYTQAAISITKLYAPSVALGVVSLGCLVGSHRILSARNASLMAAYATLEKGFAQYRERVAAEVGSDREKTLRYGQLERDEETGKTTFESTGSDLSVYARLFDECSRNWNRTPSYNQVFLRAQQNYANDLLRARGHVFLNEVYDMLGLERTKAGAVVGWTLGHGGDEYIDFGVFEGDVWSAMRFVNGDEKSIMLDFNVDGVIYDKI